jgi:hypothetical protein
MTPHESTVQPANVPGRGWYIVAGAVFAAAMGLFAAVMYGQISDIDRDFVRLTAPGQTELTLDAGRYTIFHEQVSSAEGRVGVGSPDGLLLSIHPRGGGPAVPLTGDRSSRYSLRDRSGQALFTFAIAEPGLYQITSRYEDGRSEPQVGLAVGRGFVGTLLRTIFTGLAIAFGGAAIAGAIAFVTYRRRRRGPPHALS